MQGFNIPITNCIGSKTFFLSFESWSAGWNLGELQFRGRTEDVPSATSGLMECHVKERRTCNRQRGATHLALGECLAM